MNYHADTGNWSSSAADSGTGTSFLAKVKCREPDAWRRLVELYAPLIYRWCRSAGLQPTDAADVSQEVFIRVAKSVETFQPKGSGGGFRAWLWGVTRHRLQDFYRQLRNKPQATGGSTARMQWLELPDDLDISTVDHSPERATRLGPALSMVQAGFEPRTWQAFWRVAIDARRPAEVAAELGMTVRAVLPGQGQGPARVAAAVRRVRGCRLKL